MNKAMKKLIPILVYLLIIFNFIGFDISKLFDVKLMFLIISGTVILSISGFRRGMSLIELRKNLSWNAMTAGYLTTFVFIFVGISDLTSMQELFQEIALDSRLLLYAFILHTLLGVENETESDKLMSTPVLDSENDIQDIMEKNDSTVYDEIEKAPKKAINMTEEEVYFFFRSQGLTKKESEIARLITIGMTNLEIAEELYIAESTVKKHVSHIFEKLEIKSREEVKYYLEDK